MYASFWTWHGWDALVALGTLSLAAVTAGLVGFTYKLASRTKDLAEAAKADVLAQWRPVVLTAPSASRGTAGWSP